MDIFVFWQLVEGICLQLHQKLISLWYWQHNNILKVWWWSNYPFLRYLGNRQTDRQADRQIEATKNIIAPPYQVGYKDAWQWFVSWVLSPFHWFPINHHLTFKVLSIVHQAIHNVKTFHTSYTSNLSVNYLDFCSHLPIHCQQRGNQYEDWWTVLNSV